MKVLSEGPVKITKATIDAAWRRRSAHARLIVRDKDCRGLALIVNQTTITWSYAYRPRGINPETGRRWGNRTITIGNPASHSPDDARAETNRIKGRAAAGHDPAAERKAQAAADQRKRGTTLSRLVEDYSVALARRQKMNGPGLPTVRYVAAEVVQLRLAIAAMNGEEISASSIGAADLRRLIDASSQGAIGRRRFGSMHRFFDWCQSAGHVSVNPCTLIDRGSRPRAPPARSHYMAPTVLAQLWRAADGLRAPAWRDLARFLIAVPCRRAEGATMEWRHVDLASSEWHQPGHLTKNAEAHRLHLHPLALAILRARYEAADRPTTGLVFEAPVSRGPIDNFHDLKIALTESSGVSGWRWHDTRRSFATALGEAGIPEVVADAILNHRQSATRSGVLSVYQRASRWPEQVKAMELWGRLLTAAIEGRDTDANVLPTVAYAG